MRTAYLHSDLRRISLTESEVRRWADRLSKRNLMVIGRTFAPVAIAMAASSVAYAQGSMDFSGATTLTQAVRDGQNILIAGATISQHSGN